jgi:hypothetical protein
VWAEARQFFELLGATMQKGSKARQREKLVLAMLQQPNLEKAAASIGISNATAWRITNTPEYQQEFRQARRAAFSHATARLQSGAGAAASALLKAMLDQSAPAASRVRAADLVFQHGAKGLELEDIEARVAELERAADASKSDEHE